MKKRLIAQAQERSSIVINCVGEIHRFEVDTGLRLQEPVSAQRGCTRVVHGCADGHAGLCSQRVYHILPIRVGVQRTRHHVEMRGIKFGLAPRDKFSELGPARQLGVLRGNLRHGRYIRRCQHDKHRRFIVVLNQAHRHDTACVCTERTYPRFQRVECVLKIIEDDTHR